uniref:Uncharacterized protein n=1 Tax=Varanus komodoensis TaxID=61221 RepID=A0A8D2LIZ7_VARKO
RSPTQDLIAPFLRQLPLYLAKPEMGRRLSFVLALAAVLQDPVLSQQCPLGSPSQTLQFADGGAEQRVLALRRLPGYLDPLYGLVQSFLDVVQPNPFPTGSPGPGPGLLRARCSSSPSPSSPAGRLSPLRTRVAARQHSCPVPSSVGCARDLPRMCIWAP